MKTKLLALLLGTSVILGACGGGEEAADEGKDTQGKTGETTSADAETLVQQSCISCHGENLEGRTGPDLREIGAKYDKDEIKNIIVNGQGSMPSGVLNDADAEVVASWLAEKK